MELVQSEELAVGEKLPAEADLARSFGVSRPVVREALEALRTAGIVTSRAGYGSVVAARRPSGALLLGGYAVEELQEVRRHLEVPGAGLAAERRRPSQVAELESIIDRLEVEDDAHQWVKLDAEFHVCVARATGNGVQIRLVEDFRDLLIEQSLMAAVIPERLARANREHRAVFDAVARGDSAEARRAMERHLTNVERLLGSG